MKKKNNLLNMIETYEYTDIVYALTHTYTRSYLYTYYTCTETEVV